MAERAWVDRVGRALDGVVGVFSPRAALLRRWNRLGLSRLDDLQSRRRLRGSRSSWPNEQRNSYQAPASADAETLDELPELRAKSGELVRQDAYAAGVIDAMVANVVGTGLRPQSRVRADRLGITENQAKEWQDAVEDVYEKWSPQADAASRHDFGALQSALFRSALERGDSLAHPVMRPERTRVLGLAIEAVEGDRLMTPASLAGKEGDTVFGGVELDPFGAPVAYHVATKHPDHPFFDETRDVRRVDAMRAGRPNVLHIMKQRRLGQTRGEPFLSPVVNDLEALGAYKEATLESAKVAACFSAFIKKQNPAETALGRSSLMESLADGGNDPQGRIEELYPGIVEYLNTDEDVTFADPKQPTGVFGEFLRAVLRAVAAGLQLPYPVVARDFERSNFSNNRAEMLEAWRMFNCWQELIGRVLCQPVWAMLIEEAWLADLLPDFPIFENFEEWTRATWNGPRRGWVDPVKEVQASADAIALGISTLPDECAQQGKDWQENIRKNAEAELFEQQVREELGLATAPEPPSADDEDGEEQEDDDQADTDAETAEEPETEEVPA